jgi:hypothetical protein
MHILVRLTIKVYLGFKPVLDTRAQVSILDVSMLDDGSAFFTQTFAEKKYRPLIRYNQQKCYVSSYFRLLSSGFGHILRGMRCFGRANIQKKALNKNTGIQSRHP